MLVLPRKLLFFVSSVLVTGAHSLSLVSLSLPLSSIFVLGSLPKSLQADPSTEDEKPKLFEMVECGDVWSFDSKVLEIKLQKIQGRQIIRKYMTALKKFVQLDISKIKFAELAIWVKFLCEG